MDRRARLVGENPAAILEPAHGAVRPYGAEILQPVGPHFPGVIDRRLECVVIVRMDRAGGDGVGYFSVRWQAGHCLALLAPNECVRSDVPVPDSQLGTLDGEDQRGFALLERFLYLPARRLGFLARRDFDSHASHTGAAAGRVEQWIDHEVVVAVLPLLSHQDFLAAAPAGLDDVALHRLGHFGVLGALKDIPILPAENQCRIVAFCGVVNPSVAQVEVLIHHHDRRVMQSPLEPLGREPQLGLDAFLATDVAHGADQLHQFPRGIPHGGAIFRDPAFAAVLANDAALEVPAAATGHALLKFLIHPLAIVRVDVLEEPLVGPIRQHFGVAENLVMPQRAAQQPGGQIELPFADFRGFQSQSEPPAAAAERFVHPLPSGHHRIEPEQS